MSDQVIIPGTIKNGLVIPQRAIPLPEGSSVGIVVNIPDGPPEFLQEMAAWEIASDEAWRMIDEWEKEERAQ